MRQVNQAPISFDIDKLPLSVNCSFEYEAAAFIFANPKFIPKSIPQANILLLLVEVTFPFSLAEDTNENPLQTFKGLI